MTMPGAATCLRAALDRPLALQTALLALTLGVALILHAGPPMLLFVALAQLGCAATMVTVALDASGGKPPPDWGRAARQHGLAGIRKHFRADVRHTARHAPPPGGGTTAILATARAGAARVPWRLGQRGWLGRRRRPHPFLVH